MVKCCLTHILDVVGTNGFLCIRDAFVCVFDTAIKVLLEGCHTRVDPPLGGIVHRNQGSSRFNHVILFFKVI